MKRIGYSKIVVNCASKFLKYMKFSFVLKSLFLLILLNGSFKTYAQCFEIESILIDACSSGAATNDEGLNEMVRFKVGSAAINTSTINVVWPNAANSWTGLLQNPTTASKVATLNAGIASLGGCGQLLEPVGGVLPANAKVLLITSYNFSITANVFGALTNDIYILFQNNPANISGNFANYGTTGTLLRTLTISFGACSDSVTYDKSLLIDATGAPAAGDGASVEFTTTGAPTYTNYGCVAPIDLFIVDAGSPVNACPGDIIALTGTAQGQSSVAWTSAGGGTFSNSAALSTNYTVPASATGTIVLTLTAINTANSCGSALTIFDTVTITINSTVTPTFAPVAAICSGQALTALPTTSTNGIVGTWLPALDNTATTTYTFTPNTGQCAVTTTLLITVNPSTIPAFAPVAAICSGQALTALPTTSTNGIVGVWTPSLNNSATTTYTFTPNSGQCAVTTTLIITVNSASTIPTFAPVAAICAGQALTALPTTSTNGIVGVWSPALDNTSTTTYTFTPNAGQCAVVTTLSITVNASTIPTFAPVAAICAGQVLTALPTTSTNGIVGVWSPALNNTATTTYTFAPNAGQCAVATTLIITVNSASTIPTFAPVAAICAGQTLAALPATSTNGIVGVWSPALNNTATTTYTFTPNSGQCAVATILIITVNAASTIPTFAPVAAICAGQILAALPTTSTNGIVGVWSPALNNAATTTYTFTPNAGQCAVTTTLSITVNSASTLPTFAPITAVCSGQTLAALPTTSTNGIVGVWSPALNNTATTTYTFTPNPGQCAVTNTLIITINPIIVPTFNAIPAICAGQTLTALPTTSSNGIVGTWAPALNNTTTTTYSFTPSAGQCASTKTLIIVVTPLITPTFTPIAAVCSGQVLSALPTTSNNGIVGSWAPVLNNTTTTTYTFTPNAGQCATAATLQIVITPKATPIFASVAAICSGQTLTALPTTSSNGIVGTWAPALNNTATTTYTFTPAVGQCAVAITLRITVNAATIIPTFNPIAPICSGQTLAPLPTTSINGIVGSWTPALNTSTTTTYTFTPNPGQCAVSKSLTITVNAPSILPSFNPIAPICEGQVLAPLPTNSTNGIIGTWSPALNTTATTVYTFTPNIGQCALRAVLTISVTPKIVPDFPANYHFCSGAAVPTLGLVSPNGIHGTWFPAIIDNSNSGTYVFTPNAGECAKPITLIVTITDNTTNTQNHFICLDALGNALSTVTIATGLSATNYTFTWTFDGVAFVNNSGSYSTSQAGTYVVVATDMLTGCTKTILANVQEIPAATATVAVGNDFEDQQQIIVTVIGGLGNYEYQLNNGLFQSSNVFVITEGGEYTVTVRDNAGCNNFELPVLALNYPKYFTPNDDGYHDTWNINDLPHPGTAIISIFDRYGKLLKQIAPSGVGWDGIYNGKPIPSSDYWFKLLYENQQGVPKEFRGHFSLKR